VTRAAALAAALALAAGCAGRAAAPDPGVADLTLADARFRVRWSPGDARGARHVIRALEAAAPRVRRWGALARPVTVTVHPDHEALEAAAAHPGYVWLHAWARYDTIEIQSPGSWSFFGASARELEELVTHELTHCAVYQLAGDELSWMYKEIPRWFGEGLATVTAGQGHRFPGAEALSRFYAERPTAAALRGDPLLDPDPIYAEHWRVVYGASHLAMRLLLERYGEERVRGVIREMGRGERFPAAFRRATGVGDAEFAAEVRRYVVSDAWRR
jgi:hypothetical protein